MTERNFDKRYMRQAIAEAQAASARGEVPVGAVLCVTARIRQVITV